MITKNFQLIILGFLSLIITSCGEDTSEQQEEYHDVFQEVLKVHDKLMVRMTDIYEYSKKLKNTADTSAAPEQYIAARERLQEADDRMMTWMEHFGDTFVKNKAAVKKMDREQLQTHIKALKAELNDVEQMQAEMTTSLEKAETLIN